MIFENNCYFYLSFSKYYQARSQDLKIVRQKEKLVCPPPQERVGFGEEGCGPSPIYIFLKFYWYW